MVALTIALALLCAVTSRAELTIPAHKLRQRISLSKAESKLQVPKIIHQSWKTDSVPDRFLKWQESWKTTHPDWEYRLWTDAENRDLVAKYYPWFLDTYDYLPHPIMKADSVRLLYMHMYGGMYADLDYEAVRNMEELLQGHSVYLADMNSEKAHIGLQQLVPNAWMASVPRHPFWLICLQRIIRNAGYTEGYMDAEVHMDKNETERMVPIAEHITGPGCIAEGLEVNEKLGGKGVFVIPAKHMYPFHWLMNDPEHGGTAEYDVCDVRHKKFDDDACKQLFPEAYAITYWTHSWG